MVLCLRRTGPVASLPGLRRQRSFLGISFVKPFLSSFALATGLLVATGALAQPKPTVTLTPGGEWQVGLMQSRVGLETMDTQAACRTYNILAGEGRKVAAALLVEASTSNN